jgi:two-component system phosphate regulon response regulator PhoB
MHKILVVEDSAEAYHLVHSALGSLYKLDWAKTRKDAARMLEKTVYDLILLDGTLPDGDGFQLCSLLQAHEAWATIPVILLTARTTVMDKVMAFSVGADDFVSKPFEPLELRARIEAKLRRRERQIRASDVIICGDFEIDKRTQRAVINENGGSRELILTPIEFKMLLLFASKPDIVHSRDKILDAVWGSNVHVYARSVDTHVSKLRRKLGSKQDCIVSVHGTGYRMLAPENDRAVQRLTNEMTHPRSSYDLSYGIAPAL